VTHIYS